MLSSLSPLMNKIVAIFWLILTSVPDSEMEMKFHYILYII